MDSVINDDEEQLSQNQIEQEEEDEDVDDQIDDYTLVDKKIPITTISIAKYLHCNSDCHIKRILYCECCELEVFIYVLNVPLETHMYEEEWFYYVTENYIIKVNSKIDITSMLAKFQLYEFLNDDNLRKKIKTELQFIIDFDLNKNNDQELGGEEDDNNDHVNDQVNKEKEDDDKYDNDHINDQANNDLGKEDDDKYDNDHINDQTNDDLDSVFDKSSYSESGYIKQKPQIEFDYNTKGITLMKNQQQQEDNYEHIGQHIQDVLNYTRVRVSSNRIQLENDCFNLCVFPFKYEVNWENCTFKFSDQMLKQN